MSKKYKIKIIVGSSPGPFTIYYIVDNVETVATLSVDGTSPASNLTYEEISNGVEINLPDEVDSIKVVDESDLCEYSHDIISYCLVYFITYNNIVYVYLPEDNTTISIGVFDFDVFDMAMTETKMWILTLGENSDTNIVEYDITVEPFTFTNKTIYGPLTSTLAITSANNGNLYGIGGDGIYEITTTSPNSISETLITSIPSGFVADELYYNISTTHLIAIGRYFESFSNWPMYIYEYDLSGNIVGSLNVSEQVTSANPRMMFSHNGDTYLVMSEGETYLIDIETSTLTYIKTIKFDGSIASGKQLDSCANILLTSPKTTIAGDYTRVVNRTFACGYAISDNPSITWFPYTDSDDAEVTEVKIETVPTNGRITIGYSTTINAGDILLYPSDFNSLIYYHTDGTTSTAYTDTVTFRIKTDANFSENTGTLTFDVSSC